MTGCAARADATYAASFSAPISPKSSPQPPELARLQAVVSGMIQRKALVASGLAF